MASKQSPYLEPNRLGDVLAAIQAMGSNEKFRQNCEDWTRIILGPQDDQTDDKTKEQTNHWKTVFDQHPEFFRRSRPEDPIEDPINDQTDDRKSGEGKERYSLIWRRAQPLAHIQTGKKALVDVYERLTPSEQKEHWRPPLSFGAVRTLMAIAIEMHARAVEEKHWYHRWISPVFSLIGVVAGALIAFAAVWLWHPHWPS